MERRAGRRSQVLRILVVDDSAVTRAILSQALHHSGSYEVVFASDGEQAKLLVGSVELVITDWMMPKMDGLTLTRWIRDNEAYRNLPVIMITAADQDEASRGAAREAGVDLFIEKTFASGEMAEAIERAIAMRGGDAPDGDAGGTDSPDSP